MTVKQFFLINSKLTIDIFVNYGKLTMLLCLVM